MFEDEGVLALQVAAHLAIHGDEPDAVTEAIDMLDAACMEGVPADRHTTQVITHDDGTQAS